MGQFYKVDLNVLVYGPSVHGKGYTLLSALHHTYDYPVDGWYWFDTEQEALQFFGINKNEEGEYVMPDLQVAVLRELIAPILLQAQLPPEQLAALVSLYPEYVAGKHYGVDDIFNFGNNLYRVIQEHTAQEDWRPDELPALYRKIQPEGVIPQWIQPAGAHDAYQAGDKVTHKDKTWESNVDNNVWEPGVFGWIEINI